MPSRSKPRRKSKAAASAPIALPVSDKDSVPDLPKDDEEKELERLVFGDAEGFREGLKAFGDVEVISTDDEGDAGEGQDVRFNAAMALDFASMRDDELFFVDDTPAAGALSPRPQSQDVMEIDTVPEDQRPKPAWEDSDDERITVSLANHSRTRKLRDTEADDVVTGKEYARRLRRQFERIYPVPDWALPEQTVKRRRRSPAESDDSDDDAGNTAVSAPSLSALLSSAATLTAAKSSLILRPEVIDIHRLTDANKSGPAKSGVRCLSFHPTHPLLLTSGFDSTLRLYHIDGTHNPQATSLHIRHSPLSSTMFVPPAGNRIIASGRRRYFHVWNLESGTVERVTRVYGHADVQRSMEWMFASPDGKYIALVGSQGTIQILDGNTCQWISTATVEGVVADLAWHPDGELLTIANKVGEVYEYHLTTKGVSHVWRDEGGVATTVVANSSRFVAVGSASGVVNIYDRTVSFSGPGKRENPKPVKTIESLITSVSVAVFSNDGQLLCIASNSKKDALRIVHLPSYTLYKNWPTAQTPLGKVTAVAWAGGKNGIWLAVGNEAGKVRLWEVRG